MFSGDAEEDSSKGRKRLKNGGGKQRIHYELPCTSIDSSKDEYTTLKREEEEEEEQSNRMAASCSPPPHNEPHSYLVLEDNEGAGGGYETVGDAAPNSRHIDLHINITSDKNIVCKVIS